MATTPYPQLFSEWTLGPLTLRNRILLSAMTTGFGYVNGKPTADLLAYFTARSSDVALATVAFGAVAPEGRVEQKIPWMWLPDIAGAIAPLAGAIADSGAVPCLQLGHGGRQVSPKVTGTTPVAPSPVPPPVHVAVTPHALSTAEVEETIAAFVSAAVAAHEAGFRAVELHAAHGYLVQQFLSASSNRRDDRFGEDRARFGVEVIEGIRRHAPDLALIVRINGSDLVEGGLDVADAIGAAIAFEAAGAHALLVSAGVYGSVPYTIPLLDDPEGCFLELAAAVRMEVDIPVIGVGRITTPDTAERAIARGDVDAVAIGRALLADPEWVSKAAAGDVADIRPCIATVQGCAGMLQYGDPISCAVNPEVGREGRPVVASSSGQQVTVVGGGPAGMEAARRAAELGHRVTLVERADQLGGQLRWAAATPPLRHFAKLIAWYERQLEMLAVEVRVGTDGGAHGEIDVHGGANVHGEAHVIVATGAETAIPAIDGFDLMPSWTLAGYFSRDPGTTGTASPTGRVCVVGSGQRALATALHVAVDAASVVLIADGRLGSDTSGLARRVLIDRCDFAGVQRVTGIVSAITASGVFLADRSEVACDSIVLAEPLHAVVPSNLGGIRVGDAQVPGDIATAIASGRQAAEALS